MANFCDCERGHNGLGLATRECDCQENDARADVSVEGVVPVIRAMWQSTFKSVCHFHLSVCPGCGGPSFSQPCANCGFYPMASDRESEKSAYINSLQKLGKGTREAFIDSVEKAGGIGAWYFASYRRTVAYSEGISSTSKPSALSSSKAIENESRSFKDDLERLIERAKEINWPSAGEIWKAVCVNGIRMPSSDFESNYRADWQQMAIDIYGVDDAKFMMNFHGGRYWYSWPENCQEGMGILSQHGQNLLEKLGIVTVPNETSPNVISPPR